MRSTLQPLLAAFLCLSIMACAFLEERQGTSRLATQYATIKVIDGDPARAARVIEIAGEVRDRLSGETAASVDLLTVYVRERIDWSRLDAADTLLINALLDELAAELRARLGDGVLPPEQVLVIDRVAQWIQDAARLV